VEPCPPCPAYHDHVPWSLSLSETQNISFCWGMIEENGKIL
jgi:hypothetical protein